MIAARRETKGTEKRKGRKLSGDPNRVVPSQTNGEFQEDQSRQRDFDKQ